MDSKTLIVQSYRISNIPEWITTCMYSVKRWATINEFEYCFVDDSFFDYAPLWTRELPGDTFYPRTDIARLYLLKDKLSLGYDRVVWVDVLVFDTHQFYLPDVVEHAFAGELLYMRHLTTGEVIAVNSVNNSVMFFTNKSPMLDVYITRSEYELRNSPISRTMIGPSLLRVMYNEEQFPVLTSVGLFSVYSIGFIQKNQDRFHKYTKDWGYPLGAANMCGFQTTSSDNKDRDGVTREDIDQAIADACTYLLSIGNDQCAQ